MIAAHLPRFTTGEVVRFTDGRQGMQEGAPWGDVRIAYLQYGSDPSSANLLNVALKDVRRVVLVRPHAITMSR